MGRYSPVFSVGTLGRERLGFDGGEDEVKSSPLLDLGFYPNAPSMSFYNLFADRQSHAGAGIFLPAMKSLKDDEDSLGVLRSNADTVVAHGDVGAVFSERGGIHVPGRERGRTRRKVR